MKPLAVGLLIGAGALLLSQGAKIMPTSENAKKFLPILGDAEKKYGIPSGILQTMARIESSFNPSAVGPATKYGRAVGIMQIMPSQHPDVNPLDPLESIDYAARYLKQLYRQFGTWQDAVAAYNAGPGLWANVKRGRVGIPAETANYVKKVMG